MEWLTRSYAPTAALASRGRVTATLLVIAALAAPAILVAPSADSSPISIPTGLGRLVLVGVVLAAIYLINRRGLVLWAGLVFSLALLAGNFLLWDLSAQSLPGPAILIVPILVAGLLAQPAAAFLLAALAIGGHIYTTVQANPLFLTDPSSGLVPLLSVYGHLLGVALTVWLFARTTNSTLEESARAATELALRQQSLEIRASVQSRYLQATITIAREIVGARDMDQLLDRAVRLIRETFDYYHVQVFLIDEEREYAVLRSSTGEAGQELLARGYRLPVGSLSVIGQVTAGGRPVLARDTDTDAVHRRNELLPLTRSEMALPLIVGNRVIGALDLQSVEPDAFSDEAVPTLQALADQLAIAIENARLYAQTQQSLRELEELYGEVTERSWADFLAATRETERRQVYGPEPSNLQMERSMVVRRVLSAGSVIMATGRDGQQAFLAAPIVVRNEVIGVLGVEPDGAREWTQDDLQLIQSVAERTALAVENARLYLQAQRAAERERMVNAITARLQRAPNLSLLLESAAQELAQALGTDHVYAEISLNQPLAQARREATGIDVEPVEGEAKPTEEPKAETKNKTAQDAGPLKPDTSAEARAKP